MSQAIGDAFAWTCPRAEARDIRPLFRQSHQTGATLQSHRHARPRHAPSKGNDTERMRHSPMTGLGKNPHPSCILLPAWVFLQRPLPAIPRQPLDNAVTPPSPVWTSIHLPTDRAEAISCTFAYPHDRTSAWVAPAGIKAHPDRPAPWPRPPRDAMHHKRATASGGERPDRRLCD